MELASALRKYKNSRGKLIDILKGIYDAAGMKFPFREKGVIYDDICPFTVFGSFNKGITDANRIALLEQFAKQFSVKSDVPTEFAGIPVVMNLMRGFLHIKSKGGNMILIISGICSTKLSIILRKILTKNERAFITAYDKVIGQKGIKWNITMGLYWIRPYTYIIWIRLTVRSFPMQIIYLLVLQIFFLISIKDCPTESVICLCVRKQRKLLRGKLSIP